MNSYKTTTELKSIARELLLGKYGIYIATTAIVELIIVSISLIVSYALPTGTVWGIVFNLVITFIITLISSVFSLGLNYFTLNICRKQPYKISNIFYGFSSHPDKAIAGQFFLTVIDVVCYLPAVLFWILYTISQTTGFLMVIASLLLVIGATVSVIVHLSLDFVFYTMLDYPAATVKELFRYCYDVMRGHRIKLFYLYVSFLPLYMLGLLSMGIGLVFVVPYQKVAIAQFYQDTFFVPEEEIFEEGENTL